MNGDIDSLLSKVLQLRTKETLNQCGISKEEIFLICRLIRPILKSQPNLLELKPPLTLVGDIHGQLLDLLRIFENTGYPPNINYLFLGDYVDRGVQSIEVIIILFIFKVRYPQNFFILRGNHESREMNKEYGFYTECMQKYDVHVYNAIEEIFDWLPLAALIGNKIFCIHGGLSPLLKNVTQIKEIDRPIVIGNEGLIYDLVWSDPNPESDKWSHSKRNVGISFGKEIVKEFLEHNNLDLIVRAHELENNGYSFPFGQEINFITLFSAPNYCGTYGNKGAILHVNEDLVCSFTVFNPIDWTKKEFIKETE